MALDDPTEDLPASADPASVAAESATPESIGPYRIERLLGEGGMGRVYLAHQETPVRRTVALKLIKPGVESKPTLARFEAERQSLELMDHPSIARVLDAGETQDRRPYFVMEYVHGMSITRFCNEKQLSTKGRIDLMIRVCEAVQHAHVKGVIHRDIKPSNVLVTMTDRGPLPKVIDFGIAKATGERILDWSQFTEVGRLIGTPEYMSPEQADTSRNDVDTRTDVYALGVMLYELLVGRTPHEPEEIRKAGLEEMLRQIREVDLPTPSSLLSTGGDAASTVATERSTDPSQLLQFVRGELDWITMRALEKNRDRRYGSTRELADDLRRFLAHEPVLARAPSAAYRFRKFVRRHRTAVGFGSLALLALLVFGAAMAWQAGVVARERDRARIAAASAERVSELLVDLFQASDPYGMQGSDVSARELLDRGSERVRHSLGDEPELLARMLATMGWAYDGLGEHQRAAEMLEQAVALSESERGPDDEQTIRALAGLADVRQSQMRNDDADALLLRVIESRERTLGPSDRQTLRTRMRLSEMWIDQGRYDDARTALEELHATHVELFGPEDGDSLASGTLLAIALGHTGAGEEAVPMIDAAVAGLQLSESEYEPGLANILMRLGWACTFAQRPDDAEQVYRRVLVHRDRFLGAAHPQTLQVPQMLANVFAQQKRWDEVIPLHESLLSTRQRVLGPDHPSTLFTMTMHGAYLIDAGRLSESEAILDQAIAEYDRLGLEDFGSLRARTILANVYRHDKRPDEALTLHLELQPLCEERLGERHPVCWSNLAGTAESLRSLGQVERAEAIEAVLEATRRPAPPL